MPYEKDVRRISRGVSPWKPELRVFRKLESATPQVDESTDIFDPSKYADGDDPDDFIPSD